MRLVKWSVMSNGLMREVLSLQLHERHHARSLVESDNSFNPTGHGQAVRSMRGGRQVDAENGH